MNETNETYETFDPGQTSDFSENCEHRENNSIKDACSKVDLFNGCGSGLVVIH